MNLRASLPVSFSYTPLFTEKTGDATCSPYVAFTASLHVPLAYDAAVIVVLVPNLLMEIAPVYLLLSFVGTVPSRV